MADLSNSSFIPKRGPVNRQKRGGASRQIYVFTLVSYVLMFATLIATGGVYLYGNYVNQQLSGEVESLNTAIKNFSKADMQKVIDFDLRLSQSQSRLDNSVSVVSVFEALESATINNAQIVSLNITREDDEALQLAALIETDSFDSTIFQRGVYSRNQSIESVNITDITTSSTFKPSDLQSTAPVETGSGKDDEAAFISFTAELAFPISAIPYVPARAVTVPPPPVETFPSVVDEGFEESVFVEDEAVSAQDEVINEENI